MEKVIIILSLINKLDCYEIYILLFIYRKRNFNTPVSDVFFWESFDLKFIHQQKMYETINQCYF